MKTRKTISTLCICVIPLYTEQEFNIATGNDLLPCKCTICDSIFHKRKRVIQRISKSYANGNGKYCSPKCSGSNLSTLKTVECKQCKKVFQKRPSQITSNSFCSQSCSATYNNTHKTHGTRRSKLEVWLEQQLLSLYPSLEFHFARKDAINSELDIYIPSLKLAFELNGIFHYEPIYGPEKLAQIQNNDDRKYQACIEHGIELCLVDVSSFIKFKPQGALKYLVGIQGIIDQKLLSCTDGRNRNDS